MASSGVVPKQKWKSFTADQLRDYAKVSGDSNPIHLDPAAAKKAGLKGVIVHGMFIASGLEAWTLDFFQMQFPKSNRNIKKISTRFKAMTFPGENLLIEGEYRQGAGSTTEIDLKVTNEAGELKISSKVLVEN